MSRTPCKGVTLGSYANTLNNSAIAENIFGTSLLELPMTQFMSHTEKSDSLIYNHTWLFTSDSINWLDYPFWLWVILLLNKIQLQTVNICCYLGYLGEFITSSEGHPKKNSKIPDAWIMSPMAMSLFRTTLLWIGSCSIYIFKRLFYSTNSYWALTCQLIYSFIYSESIYWVPALW